MKERPEVAYANVKDSRVNNKYGIDPSTKDYWLIKYRDYIEQNIDKMDDIEQIEAAIKFRNDKKYNCDITISCAIAEVHAIDNIHLQVKQVSEEKHEPFASFKTDRRGRLISV